MPTEIETTKLDINQLDTIPKTYDLGKVILDLTGVAIIKEGEGYRFTVPNQEIGRKIGFEIATLLGIPTMFFEYYLNNNEHLVDFRLDGGELSFTEYTNVDEGFVITILPKYPSDEYLQKFDEAINKLQSITECDKKDEEELLSYEDIEQALTFLTNKGIFGGMRANMTDRGTFFDPEREDLTEQAGTETGTLLNQFRTAFLSGEIEAHRNYLYTQREIENWANAFKPESVLRKVFLAYFSVNEETQWIQTKDRILNRQSYKNEGFPTKASINFIASNI